MTSAEFETVVLDSILVKEDRQRRDLGSLDDLKQSINAVGLINPPVITRDFYLVTGERRLTACRELGWTHIPIQWVDDLDPLQLELIELEENVKRKDLTWQEQNDAIARYHQMRAELDPDWNPKETAEALGTTAQSVNQHIKVHKARQANPELDKKQKFSEARSFVQREEGRKRESALAEVIEQTESPFRIVNASFHEWAPAYEGEKFNLAHVDFPYGVTATRIGQSAARTFGGYDDRPEDYLKLIDTFIQNQDRFLFESAHMIFWYSMNTHAQTVEQLREAGWVVNPFPLIWVRSDNRGILPDANRGPRRVYETALFATRGDRPIVSAVGNAFSYPTEKTIHASEKPAEMVRHFLRMLVDSSTRILDPTAGSGTAIRAAKSLGASAGLGLELNAEYAALASEALNDE